MTKGNLLRLGAAMALALLLEAAVHVDAPELPEATGFESAGSIDAAGRLAERLLREGRSHLRAGRIGRAHDAAVMAQFLGIGKGAEDLIDGVREELESRMAAARTEAADAAEAGDEHARVLFEGRVRMLGGLREAIWR